MTDYVNPKELLQEAVQLAKRKSVCPLGTCSFAESSPEHFSAMRHRCIVVTSQRSPSDRRRDSIPRWVRDARIARLELVTGNFALLPAASWPGQSVSRSCFAIGAGCISAT